MGYYDFPHTRNYDSDLGFLIHQYKIVSDKYDTLLEIYDVVQKQITDITIEQLQKWLDDGTLENIINQQLLGDLNTQLSTLQSDFNNYVSSNNLNMLKKTNIEEFKQNRIQGICRTYGMWEKGNNAWFTTNDFDVRPGVSGIRPSVAANSYESRDSVALGAFGLGNPPLIKETTSSFTSTSVTLPNLNYNKIIDPIHNLKIADLDFSDTFADIYVNGTRTYFGFVHSFNKDTKTFTLNSGTGFYKVNSSDLTTYTPPSNSTVIIGDINAVWGANIIAQDQTNAGDTNVVNLCGLELMTIHNRNTNGCRTLHLVNSGKYRANYYILGDGAQPTQNGLYLTRLTERGLMCSLDRSITNPGVFWIIGLQDGQGNDVFHIDGIGRMNKIGFNSAGVSSNGVLNKDGTIFILTDSVPDTLVTTEVVSDGRVLILCNHGTKTHIFPNILGGGGLPIEGGKTAIVTRVGTIWYPVLKTDLK